MIRCKQCSRTHTAGNAAVRFIRCECKAIIDIKSDTITTLKEHSLTYPAPSFIAIGQKGQLDNMEFEVLGRINVWSEDSILSYWTLLFENGTVQILEEGYGNFAILENINQHNTKVPAHAPLGNYKPNFQFYINATILLNIDINSKVLYTSLEGQSSLNIADPETILYCTNVYNIKTYEIWQGKNGLDIYFIRSITFEELHLEGTIDKVLIFPVKAVCTCQKCNAMFDVSYFPYVLTVECPKCNTINCFNPEKGKWEYAFPSKKSTGEIREAELPLGARIRLLGDDFEVIGKVLKRNQQSYHWMEYHLYCAYEGSFAYLSQSGGHFILLYELFEPPKFTEHYKDDVRFFNRTFRPYDIYQSEITSIEGRLIGAYRNPSKKVKAFDYVSAPYMLSLELGKDDANHWHFGEYVPRKEIKMAFDQAGIKLPRRVGYGAARPANKFALSEIVLITAIMCLIYCGIQIWLKEQNHAYHIAQEMHVINQDAKQVTIDNIDIKDDRTEITIEADADVSDNWIVLTYDLINKENGNEAGGGQEIAYYSGYEDGERWSEGSRRNTYTFSGVKKGKYKLVVEAELNPQALNKEVPLTLHVTSDGQLGKNFWFPLLLLLGWCIYSVIKYFIVEGNRFNSE